MGFQANNQVSHPPLAPNNSNREKKWSQAEYQDRRARGLCFFCDEPYKGGHVCKKMAGQGQALVIEGIMETERDSCSSSPPVRIEEVESEDSFSEQNNEETAITLHVIHSLDTPQTMQLKGNFNNKEVHVLIDGGVTHSFIHLTLLKNLKVQVDTTIALKVVVASGLDLHTTGKLQT